jgi:hypothetical protein
MSVIGRPRATLTGSRRLELRRRAERLAKVEAELDLAREALVVSMTAALEDGGSVRVVAEAVGMSAGKVHRLINETKGEA